MLPWPHPVDDKALRARRSEIAVFALVVDAKDDRADGFYRHHGFVTFGSLPRNLVLPWRLSIPETIEPNRRRSMEGF
jgi:hypothetical protein